MTEAFNPDLDLVRRNAAQRAATRSNAITIIQRTFSPNHGYVAADSSELTGRAWKNKPVKNEETARAYSDRPKLPHR